MSASIVEFTHSFRKVIVIGLAIMITGINPVLSGTDFNIQETTIQTVQGNSNFQENKINYVETEASISDGIKSRILLYDSFDSLNKAAELLSESRIKYKYHFIPALTTNKISKSEIPVQGLVSSTDNTKSITTAVDRSSEIGKRFDTAFDLEFTARNIKVSALHDLGFTGQGVSVAVIDSGIKADLPSFINNGVRRVEEWSVPDVPELADFSDIDPHATHVAGILGGNGIYQLDGKAQQDEATGMAPNVTLHSLRVLDTNGFGENDWVVRGIEKAIDLNVDIMSLSLSSELYNGSSDIHQLAVRKAIEKGIIVVAAAGNLGPFGSGVGVPGALVETISVGASDFLDNGLIGTYQFSAIGPGINDYPSPDIIAPGVNILSVDKESGYVRADTGTSMATPHVSGGIALLKEAFPNATVHQIREAILASGRQLSASEPVEKVGRGFIDFEVAYDILNETTNSEVSSSVFAMVSAPNVIKDENLVFRHQISGKTKSLPFFIHSSRNVTLAPMVENDVSVTHGVEFQLPTTIDVFEGVNKFSMNITVTSTNIEFISGRIFFQDNFTKVILPYANISYFAFVKFPQASILFDSTKDFDTHSKTYFAGHSPRGQFSYFAKLLEIEGHTVDENRNNVITIPLLSNYDMLIIANPDLYYTQDEIDAIRNFVFDEGKALLVIAGGGLIVAETDTYDQYNATTLADILQGSGLEFKRDNQGLAYTSISACESLGILDRFATCFNEAETIKTQDVLPKLIEFPHYGPPLEVDAIPGADAKSVALSHDETVVASSEIVSSNGRIMLFSSPLVFDNKGLIHGYKSDETSNNKLITSSAITWLLEPRSINIDYTINNKRIGIETDVNQNEIITIEFKVSNPSGQILQLNTDQLIISVIDRSNITKIEFYPWVFDLTSDDTYTFETSLDTFGTYEIYVFVTDTSGELISSNGHLIMNVALKNFYDQDNLGSLGVYLFFALMATWILFIYNEGGRKRLFKRKKETEEWLK